MNYGRSRIAWNLSYVDDFSGIRYYYYCRNYKMVCDWIMDTRMNFRIDRDLRDRFKNACKDIQRTVSEVIRELMEDFLWKVRATSGKYGKSVDILKDGSDLEGKSIQKWKKFATKK